MFFFSLSTTSYVCVLLECPSDGFRIKSKYCITTHYGDKDWDQALEKCRRRGGELLQLQTKEKFEDIYGEKKNNNLL